MNHLKKNRIVVKIGSNSLTHPKTGRLDYIKIERLAMELTDIRNRGMDVCLVSSGAIAVGRQTLGVKQRPKKFSEKQALSSVGQVRLMATYQKYFSEFNQMTGQILMTKNTILDNVSCINAKNTFEELFAMGVIPIVNANDAISTYEMQFGDNDTLSAIVCSLINAKQLILLSDIDGLYSEDPNHNPDATLITHVKKIDESIMKMSSENPGSDVGTGGMNTKILAAQIATSSGASMIIANAKDVSILHQILDRHFIGTTFDSNYDENFYLDDFLERTII